MKNFDNIKGNEMVRIYQYPEDSINGYGHIQGKPFKGKIWVANLNMPFVGTVSRFMKPYQIEIVK